MTGQKMTVVFWGKLPDVGSCCPGGVAAIVFCNHVALGFGFALINSEAFFEMLDGVRKWNHSLHKLLLFEIMESSTMKIVATVCGIRVLGFLLHALSPTIVSWVVFKSNETKPTNNDVDSKVDSITSCCPQICSV